MEETGIDARGLTRRFGADTAVSDLTFAVARPGVVALLGANGAGKTTFVKMALGLLPPSKGRLRIFGCKPGSAAARRRTGVMMQDADLPDLLTPREQIALFASYYPAPRGVEETIGLCGLGPFAGTRYGKLSGGQKRRVQFALALVGKPDLLFLDEPTTGLDTEARRGLWEIVRAAAEGGAQVVLTTHYLEEADALAERVLLIDGGRLVADAPAERLRARVGGALVRCAVDWSEERLAALPAVRHARRAGRYAEIVTADAGATLRALLAATEEVSDLTVRQPTLEEAVAALTGAARSGDGKSTDGMEAA